MTLQSTDKWMKNETLRALVSNGLHLGLVDSETNICYGCGTFRGAELEKTVMSVVKVDQSAKTVTIAVRSDNAELRGAFEAQLMLLLSAKK